MDPRPQRLIAVLIGAASLGLYPALGATEERPPIEQVLQFRGEVVVDGDGNGVHAAGFPTTAEGPEVRYVLYIDDALGTGVRRVPPPPVSRLAITLNDDVVFFSDEELPDPVRVQVALNPAGGESNRIVLAAAGPPRSAARVSILAVRPAVVPFGGVSILPSATIDDARTATFLVVHNAGPSPLGFRILFFRPDGSLAGRTAPHDLPAKAVENLDLSQIVGSSLIPWSRGAVHVQWASREFTRVSAAATFRNQPSDDGPSDSSVLALDDSGPRPLSKAELRDILGE
jgi:hypothetical protein